MKEIEITQKMRVARKPHKCDCCENIIMEGDSYYNHTERELRHRPHVNRHYCYDCWNDAPRVGMN